LQTLAIVFFSVAVIFAVAQRPGGPAAGVIRSWNAAIETIESETRNFLELSNSYTRNPPGRVLLAPDVRAAQKKRRLELINAIIDSHQDRIKQLRELRKYEEASQ
jgi:hypothetical protein